MPQSTTTINFGVFPGRADASATITGQVTISTTSLVEAWLYPVATADHSVDEHLVETIKVFAHTVSPGVGFTIQGFNTNQIIPPPDASSSIRFGAGQNETSHSRPVTPMPYGLFTVAWVYN